MCKIIERGNPEGKNKEEEQEMTEQQVESVVDYTTGEIKPQFSSADGDLNQQADVTEADDTVAVTHQTTEVVDPYAVPEFENVPVSALKVTVKGFTTITDDMPVFGLDDRVRIVSEFICTAVDHVKDPKTGDIVRVQIIQPVNSQPCAWSETDGADGILRARG